MSSLQFEIISILFGLFLITFVKPLARYAKGSKNRAREHGFGRREEKQLILIGRLIGLVFIALAIMDIFGAFEAR